MVISPMAVAILVMSLLAFCWLAIREQTARLNGDLPFHVSTDQRDRRKARFYFLSVWVGLVAAFIGMASLQVAANTIFDSTTMRKVILGVSYGVGLWGLSTIALVWSQVGKRVLEGNADGQSLTQLREEKKQNK